MIEQLRENKFGLSFEKGLIGPHEFYEDFKSKFQAKLTYDEFASIWCDIFYLHTDVINLVEKLTRTYSLYLISNINELHFNFLDQRYREVFELFNGLILSYKVKSIKPEEEIYYALRTMADTNFNNIIYIDDRKDLIEAASLLDLQCIQFKDYDSLLNNLSSLGVECN